MLIPAPGEDLRLDGRWDSGDSGAIGAGFRCHRPVVFGVSSLLIGLCLFFPVKRWGRRAGAGGGIFCEWIAGVAGIRRG